MAIPGHSLFVCTSRYCGHDFIPPACALGVDNWSHNYVHIVGLELFRFQCDPSYFITRNRIRDRWLFGVYALDPVHVGVVREEKRLRFRYCVGK